MSDSTDIDSELEKALKGRAAAQKRAVAFKTVDSFAGITRRRLWLKDSGKGTGACTDGHAVLVDFTSLDFYQLVEHELSHILFQSDSLARARFVADYTAKVVEVVKKTGVQLDEGRFQSRMQAIIAILEDHRVNSLWGLLYPGSYQQIVARGQLVSEDYHAAKAPHELISYFVCLESGLLNTPSPSFERFKPFLLEALRKVERRGFGSCLLAAKWLVTQLVSDIIRMRKRQPAPQAPDTTNNYDPANRARPIGGDSGSAGGGSSVPQSGGSGSGSDSGEDTDTTQDGGQNAPDNAGDDAGDGWYPPPVPASLDDRADALKQFSDLCGDENPHDDVQDPKFPSKIDVQQAKDLSDQVTGLDVNDASKMEDYMGTSAEEMQAIVDTARGALRQTMKEDDWIKKEAMAKVVFKDIPRAEADDFDFGDKSAVSRLRSQFFRVMGRTKTALAESGTEIDVQAYIEGRAIGDFGPVFKHEVRGQGFKSLILLDRSGSMYGDKTTQSDRACGIITRATRFPFVDLSVWGFHSATSGQVDISRFNRDTLSFAEAGHSGGSTPLHIATRLGLRYLSTGDEAKHLFIITDGFPVYSRRDGRDYPTWQLMMYVRDEVLAARKDGIGVSCLFIGSDHGRFDVTPKQMHFMFGSQKFWRMITPKRLGADIVSLVSSSFVEYLRRG